MCEQPSCRGLCRAMRRTSNEVLAAFLGAALLLVVAFIVNHAAAILQWVGGLAVGGIVAFAAIRWGIPAFARNYNARELERRDRRQEITRPATTERLYRPAPAQPAITPPQVHNHLHIDHETAERLFRP